MTPEQARWADRARLDFARTLRDIKQLCRSLRVEAWHRHSARDLPGGDALVMIGPVANQRQWEDLVEAAEHRYFADPKRYPWLDLPDWDTDPQPPLHLLGQWEDIVRDERDEHTSLRTTIDRAADYLARHAEWLFGFDPWGEPNFMPAEALLYDLEQMRHRLEAVLHDGIRHETGAPCLDCSGPQIKVWPDVDNPEGEILWHCRRCGRWSDEVQYRQAVRAAHLAQASTLTASDMFAQYGVNPSTLRTWVDREHVKRRGRDRSGRQLYDVADVKRYLADLAAMEEARAQTFAQEQGAAGQA